MEPYFDDDLLTLEAPTIMEQPIQLLGPMPDADFQVWLEQQVFEMQQTQYEAPGTDTYSMPTPASYMVPNSTTGIIEIQQVFVNTSAMAAAMGTNISVEPPLPDNYTRPPKRVRYQPMDLGENNKKKDMKEEVTRPATLSYNTKSFNTAVPKTNDVTIGNEMMAGFNLAVYLMEKKIAPVTVKEIGCLFANRACLNCIEVAEITGVPKRGDVVKGEMYCNTCLMSKHVILPPTQHEQFDKWLQQPFHKWCYNMKAE